MKDIVKNTAQSATVLIAGYMLFDMMLAIVWAASGQVETQGFYFGKLTVEIIRAITF